MTILEGMVKAAFIWREQLVPTPVSKSTSFSLITWGHIVHYLVVLKIVQKRNGKFDKEWRE